MDKKLKISLDLDDKAFSSAIKRMQAQLSQAFSGPAMLQQQRAISQKMAQLGLGGLPGSPSDRQLEQSQQRAKQQSDRMFEDTRRKFDIIKRLQNDLNKEQSTGVASEQRKLEIKQRLLDLTEKEKRATGELRVQVDRYNTERQRNMSSGFGALVKGGVGVAGLLGGAGAAVGSLGRLPIEAASAAGSAASSLVGQQLKDMTDPSHQAFLPERGKAIEAAKRAWQAQRGSDQLINAASGIAVAVGMLGVGGALTATGIGAGAGLAIMGTGLTGMLATGKQRAAFMGNRQAYEQLSSADLADLAQQSIKAQEESDPLKKLAADYNAQNYQRNLGIQRGLGLNDQGFMGRGGFLQGNMAYGGRMQFTEEQVTQQQQAIMAAGGSARMGREAGFGLELQKNLNLTNAPQLLGGISRTMGGASETKEASMRVISEAFKQGLNDSELVDLLRGFTSATGEIIARSGAKTQSDVDRISSQFGKGMVENTGAGLEGAKTAYEAYNKLGGTTSGAFGVMQSAGLMRSPIMQKLAGMGEDGAVLLSKLQQIPPNELTEGHSVVQAIAYKTGASPADIIAAKSGAVASSMSISGGYSRNRAIVEGARKGMPYSPEYAAFAQNMANTYSTTQGVGAGSDLTSAQAVASFGAQGMAAKATPYGPSEAEKTSGKMADQVQANIAAGQQVFVDNFEKFSGAIVPATNSIDVLTGKLILLGQVIADVASGKNTDKGAVGKAAATLGIQPQATSSSSGK